MATQMVRGKLVGVVDGPAMVLEVRGRERSYPLDVDLPLDWVEKHMDATVTVLVKEGRVVEVA